MRREDSWLTQQGQILLAEERGHAHLPNLRDGLVHLVNPNTSYSRIKERNSNNLELGKVGMSPLLAETLANRRGRQIAFCKSSYYRTT